ncbi:hypothetical protein [Falsiroseomonas sp. E2-1-a20]|uniref:hypothetical protein n=1 Tax=Falsiroseomonas sp. E2-1-a20 TaxID=3239300 RepID=UPI003F366476
MPYKVLVLCIALFLSYQYRRQLLARPKITLTFFSAMMLALSAILLMAVLQETTLWARSFMQGVFSVVPLDAVAVGLVVGFVLADIRLSSIFSASPGAEKPNKILALSQAVSAGLVLAILVLAAIVPSHIWVRIFDRVQEVKAGSVSLSLRETATSVRTAAPPQDPLANRFVSVVGFAPQRINQLQSLTYPPFQQAAARSPETANDIYFDPSASEDLILSSIASDTRRLESTQTSYTIQRDRAILYRLGTGQKREAERVLREMIPRFAFTQERLLTSMRPHVICLAKVIDITRDRRLIDYANFPKVELIVSNMHVLASAWTGLEKFQTMALVGETDVAGQPLHASLVAQIEDRQRDLRENLREFNAWAARFAVERTFHERSASDLASLSSACAPPAAADAIYTPSASDLFSPYLVSFSAQLLAAIGDHASAVRLLVDWFKDLEDLERAARAVSSQIPSSNFAWMKVRLLSQLVLIQRLSERSEQAVPLRTEISRFLIQNFQSVISNHPVNIWYGNTGERCQASAERWLQPIILSYLTYLKEYLDQLNTNPTSVQEISLSDIEMAEILVKTNVSCFNSWLPIIEIIPQQAQFVLTYGTTVLTWLSSEQAPLAERERLLSDAEIRLRIIIGRLERSPQSGPRTLDSLESFVYGRAEQPLLDAARVLRQRLAEGPGLR